MLFNSPSYLLFLPVVIGVNWLLPARVRPVFLVAASYFFYASWNPPFLLLIFGLTLANYFLGLYQGRQEPKRKSLVVVALVINIGALAVFKYVGLLDDTARRAAELLGLPVLPVLQAALPLGLSFFAFEFIHYQVDLYRGGAPIVDPIRFALFPAFFPTQIAGPIKRYQDFDAQVEKRPAFDSILALEGVELIAVGLFKKVVLGDFLMRPAVDAVYAAPHLATSADAWIGLLAFYGQLYFDFSGYTDIGRGSAQLLGYKVPMNFSAPYLATTFQDFWRRWHMSLSSWIRDYIYIPLGGSRKGEGRSRVNVMISMALAGLWHGAAWHFMIFGIVCGAGVLFDRVLKVDLWPRRTIPFAVRVAGGWVVTQGLWLAALDFFRANSVGDVLVLWSRMLRPSLHHSLISSVQFLDVPLVIAGLLLAQLALRRLKPRELLAPSRLSVVLRPAYITTLMSLFLFFSAFAPARRFIYFQF